MLKHEACTQHPNPGCWMQRGGYAAVLFLLSSFGWVSLEASRVFFIHRKKHAETISDWITAFCETGCPNSSRCG